MADVRALLRQQRQSRRVDHPYAAYSDAGKLLCTLCREQIRAESQWESHIKSAPHQRRSVDATTVAESIPSETAESMPEKPDVTHDAPAAEAPEEHHEEAVVEEEEEEEEKPKAASNGTETRVQSHKRKISDEIDADEMDIDEAIRRKRSRANISVDISAANRRGSGADKDKDAEGAANTTPRREANRTPPTLTRRMSSTPSRGVELQIPSRPATPAHRDSSSSSTPGGSTLAGLTAASAAVAAQANATPSATNSTIATEKLSGGQVDEDEWAAFEAEMAATAVPYADDAVISAPAMNAEESAAATAAATNGELDGAAGSRKSRADLDIEGEREDATRALEDEFDDMQELEARVKRLKEKREELRKRTSSIGQYNGPARLQSLLPDGEKSPAAKNGVEEKVEDKAEEDDDDDDDDDDDEEDDWDGFRFRK